jgi:integrase
MNNTTQIDQKDSQTNTPPLLNNINSNEFTVKDNNTGEEFKLDVSFSSANSRWANWGREYLIQWSGNYTCLNTQTLTARQSTFEGKRNHIAKIVSWATQNKPESSLALWSEVDIMNLIKAITFNKIYLPNRNNTEQSLNVINKDTVLKIIWNISNSGYLYRKGLLSDGFLGQTDFENLISNLKVDLEELDIKYSEWIKNGKFDSVPLEVATLMLLEAINRIRSNNSKTLRAYFNIQRTSLKLNPGTTIFKKGNTLFKQVINKKEVAKHHKKKASKITNFINAFKNEYIKLGGEESFDPVKYLCDLSGHQELNDEIKHTYDACKVAFFCLTGIRVHEMKQTNSQDYFHDSDGVWRFKATEDKTQRGTKQLRAIAGVAAEAADVMCDISYIEKKVRPDNQKTYLFGLYTASIKHFNNDTTTVDHSGAAVSRESFRDRLNIFFNKVVNKYGNNILDGCAKVIPHGFRHSFVDFVLRRFDGNIHSAIRDHFRHCIRGEFTNTYTDSKAQDQIENAAQRKYMNELIHQMVGENSQDFTGPIALFIQREVSKFKFVSESDLSPLIDSLESDLKHLIPHEYGFCLVLNSRKHLAKCLDKKTGIAKVLNGCFELCSGCPNSFHHRQSNQSAIIRNIISHERFLEKFPIKNTPQAKVSKNVVLAGHNILAGMES